MNWCIESGLMDPTLHYPALPCRALLCLARSFFALLLLALPCAAPTFLHYLAFSWDALPFHVPTRSAFRRPALIATPRLGLPYFAPSTGAPCPALPCSALFFLRYPTLPSAAPLCLALRRCDLPCHSLHCDVMPFLYSLCTALPYAVPPDLDMHLFALPLLMRPCLGLRCPTLSCLLPPRPVLPSLSCPAVPCLVLHCSALFWSAMPCVAPPCPDIPY